MAGDPTSTFPYNCVVLIEAPDPSDPQDYLIGSGVVIGPNTILTASHVAYDISDQTPVDNIKLYPAWNGVDPALGAGNISTTYTDHFNEIGTFGSDDLTAAQSASDYAVIDTSYTFSSWMNVLLNYSGGEVHVTGYPASAGGFQTDSVGTVSADPSYSVLDYGTLSVSPGNSGGPLWLSENGSDDVAGIVSTSGWACQLTTADWSQIESWVAQDGDSLPAPVTEVAPVVTAVSNISLIEGQSISASSLIASISNPSGDDITEDLFEDLGGGSGYFTVNGVRQANGEWIAASPSADVQYVAGSSPGSDTLNLGIYDATTNSDDFASGSIVATTIGVADYAPNILWRNSNGDVALWNANGSGSFTSQDLGVVDPSWQIDGAGDFNGGGKDSILWRNSNGDVALWNATASGGFTFQDLGVVDSSWQIAGTGDFNGGGKDGILWRNSNGDVGLWNVNATGSFTFQDLGVVNSSWQIEGTGDFNGSGEDGVLWRNANGDVTLWNSNGAGGFTSQDLGVVGSDWQIAGTGDFNGGGKDSILWRDTNGDAALWNPNSSGGFSFEDLGVVDSSWQISGTGDFNDSGKDGIVWRNTSGAVALWNANASGSFTFQNLGVVASSWTILAA
jgi:V8-like Glu-specific endopeptidase